ncbi:hypothetical protein TrVE_jg692 [Triparma verrucosa]|uniref:PH domain-containing protein n=1 Tax=Triparma verrucosa TaxID=1606542 RepID=A0A9W7DTG8_9STRA|nr:hypothetical protein TrVE_jg692 [Triparma verrucosa]
MGCCCSSNGEDPATRLDYNEPDPEDLKKPILTPHTQDNPDQDEITPTSTRRRGSSKLFDDALSPPPTTTHIVKRGFLTKEGHRRKNWTKRYFILSAGVLSYYEKALDEYPFASGFKGHITLRDSEVSTFIGKDLKLRLTIKKSKADESGGKAFLQMKGSNDDETHEWARSVAEELDKTNGTTSRNASKEDEMQDVTAEGQPQRTNVDAVKSMRMSFSQQGKQGVKRAGWGKKKGSLRKNWKNRYFVLADGWLSYYAKGPPHVSDRKGQLPMDGCRIERVVDAKGIKIVSPIQGRTLHVEFEDDVEEWQDALECAINVIGSLRVNRSEWNI